MRYIDFLCNVEYISAYCNLLTYTYTYTTSYYYTNLIIIWFFFLNLYRINYHLWCTMWIIITASFPIWRIVTLMKFGVTILHIYTYMIPIFLVSNSQTCLYPPKLLWLWDIRLYYATRSTNEIKQTNQQLQARCIKADDYRTRFVRKLSKIIAYNSS